MRSRLLVLGSSQAETVICLFELPWTSNEFVWRPLFGRPLQSLNDLNWGAFLPFTLLLSTSQARRPYAASVWRSIFRAVGLHLVVHHQAARVPPRQPMG